MRPPSYREVFSYSLKLLCGQTYSESRLKAKLRKRGCSQAISAQVIGKLKELNLLDDRAFAETTVQNVLKYHPSGKRQIRYILEKKRIPAALAHEVVSQLKDDEVAECARELTKRYEERWKALPPIRRRKRIYDLLVRRGFDYELCREIIEEVK